MCNIYMHNKSSKNESNSFYTHNLFVEETMFFGLNFIIHLKTSIEGQKHPSYAFVEFWGGMGFYFTSDWLHSKCLWHTTFALYLKSDSLFDIYDSSNLKLSIFTWRADNTTEGRCTRYCLLWMLCAMCLHMHSTRHPLLLRCSKYRPCYWIWIPAHRRLLGSGYILRWSNLI